MRISPRKGKYALYVLPGGKSAELVRRAEDDPWSMSSVLKYTITKPHYIDVDFRCIPHDRAVFGERGYAVLFFADYMNDTEGLGYTFRGIEGPNEPEKWIAVEAPKGPADWRSGGTYRSAPASDLQYDANHNFKLNLWSYDYPRFTQPFYFGRVARDMVFMLMFNKTYTDQDEIRFSLFKVKHRHNRLCRPAWDFQYVIHKVEEGKEYEFKARLVWKRFVSPDDCMMEYEAWRSSPP